MQREGSGVKANEGKSGKEGRRKKSKGEEERGNENEDEPKRKGARAREGGRERGRGGVCASCVNVKDKLISDIGGKLPSWEMLVY